MSNPSVANLNDGPTHTGPCEFHQDCSERIGGDIYCIKDKCLECIPESEYVRLLPGKATVYRVGDIGSVVQQ